MRAILRPSTAIVFVALAHGQLTNRLPGPITSRDFFTLTGNIRPAIAFAQDQGVAPASQRIPRITIRFKLTSAQDADLTLLLADQQTPGHALYHRWLASEQYADRFGITAHDAQTIADWLQSFGFTDIDTPPSRTSISFSGTAGQVQAALQTPIHYYLVKGEPHFANATDPSLPRALESLVESISGLDDFHPKPQFVRPVARRTSPNFTTGGGVHFLTPDDLATIYDIKPLYAAAIDGSGQKIAIVGQSDIDIDDIRAFRSAAGLPQKDPVIVLAGPDPGTQADPETEADLDLEWAGGIARNATIIYVNSTDAIGSAAYAVERNLAPVISISYGACESDFGSAALNSLSNIFRQANAQGMTILASSGDEGAAGCEARRSTVATHGLAVIAPASMPYVTGVGGTEFYEDNWSPNNNRSGGSALSYMLEAAWNDTWPEGPLEASGGGKSAFFRKPAWQAGLGVPNDGWRDVPDVSLTASPNVDGYLICSAGSCANGFWSSAGTLEVVGGTSASAPAMAGIIALLDQANGGPQGNINPELYQLASISPSTFHGVYLGDNVVPCTVGTPDCTTGAEGYTASPNYNQVTGLGSIDALGLVAEWGEPNPIAIPTAPFTGFLVAGADGSLWNIDSQGHAITYNPQTLSWAEISNLAISYLWVGSSNAIWARDPSGNLYRWDPASQTFVQQMSVPNGIFSIALGADGDVWTGQSPPNGILHFDPTTNNWIPVPGELSQIVVGNDGAVWGMNAYGQIFRFNPGTANFEYVPGSLTNLYVGPDGGVWGINWAGNTYHFNRVRQSWDAFGGSMAALAVGSETNVWATDHYETPYKFSSLAQAWYVPSGPVYSVLASADGSAWAFEAQSGELVQLSPATRTLNSWHQIPGELVELSAASDGNVWGVNVLGQVYAFDSLQQKWTWIPGTLSQIAVARDGAVWGVNPEGAVYRYDYSTLGWDLMPGALAQLIPADNGDVWGLDAHGSVYRFDPSAANWTPLSASLAQLSVGADGAAWGIDAQSNVYRFEPQTGAFSLQPGSMAQISVGSSNNVWALDSAGLIYRFDTAAQTWRLIPGQLSQIRVAFDGSVWGINSQQLIWRYNASSGNWDYIPGALSFLRVGSDAVIWGINSAGETYYFQ